MTRATLYAVAWLAFTIGILIFHVGCGGSHGIPGPANPELQPKRKTTDPVAFTCLRIERDGKGEVIVCGTAQMCKHAHDRIVTFWEPLTSRYGTTGLSDCTDVDVQFTQR